MAQASDIFDDDTQYPEYEVGKRYKSDRSGRIYEFEGIVDHTEFFKVVECPEGDPCKGKSLHWLRGGMPHLRPCDDTP